MNIKIKSNVWVIVPKLLLLLTLLVSCKANKINTVGMVINDFVQSAEGVSFTIVNNYQEAVSIESTEHLYIQRKSGDAWERVPFVPCACGVPCRPAAGVELSPGGSQGISWNLISRRCRNNRETGVVETLEEKVNPGELQLVFTINRSQNGMRLNAEKLVVPFEVK